MEERIIRVRVIEALEDLNKKRVAAGLDPYSKTDFAMILFDGQSRVVNYINLNNLAKGVTWRKCFVTLGRISQLTGWDMNKLIK